MNLKISFAIALICLFLAQQSPAATVNSTANANFSTTYQQLDGFGAAGAWYQNWVANNSQKNTIYDILFRDSGFSIYRIRNTYQYDSGYMTDTGNIVSAAKARNPNIKILISSWSPPTNLKSTGQLNSGTLIGGPSNYNYSGFATWWADSVTAWANLGVNLDYLSIQNEPDWNGNDRCLFDPTENSTNAGYDKAFRAVYQEFESRWGSNYPKLLAPESGNLTTEGSYINVLDNNATDLSHIYAFANHLYNITYNSPDGGISSMTSVKNNYGYKPLMQTEYSDSTNATYAYGVYTAQHIYNALVYEGVTMYLYWEAFWNSSKGLVTLNGSYPGTPAITPPYYFMKHYSYFTRPGWYRAAATTPSSDLRITSFRDITDSNMAIVILNKSTTNDVNLTLTIDGFTPAANWLTNEIYRTTSTSNWASLGAFDPCQPLTIPAQSIVTIHIATFQTCADVNTYGYTFNADLNFDCHVDFYDFEILAGNWLRSDCTELNNWCDWTDYPSMSGTVDYIDVGNFVQQWLQCNNPLDSNCTKNW